MRSPRLRQILAVSAMIALVGCAKGVTPSKNGAPDKAMQRSSRIIKKKKPGTTSSAPARKVVPKPASSAGAR